MGILKEIDTEKAQRTCAVCSAVAPHVCSICKEVAYCGKEHQKQHWKEHKSACQPYEVKSSEELGRYLVASRNLTSKDKIVAELPLVLGPKLFEPVPVCLGCYRPPSPGMRCPGCLWPVCHPQCPGLQDPHHHSIECFILSLGKSLALTPAEFKYEIITPLRCLLLQKRNQKKWNQVIAMEAHINLRGPDTEVYRELDDMVIDYLIDNYLSKLEEGLTYSKDLIHKICGVLDVNAVEILSGGNIQLLALFPTFAILEHKCLPNTMHYFTPEYKIILTPNTNIKKGEHLSTSYSNVLWGTYERKEYLKQNKYFSCRCERCSDPTEFGTYMSALKCHGLDQTESCGGWQLPESPLNDDSEWKCDKCPVVLTSGEARNLVLILVAESDKLIKQSNPSLGEITELIRKLQFFLHPNHYLCYEAKHLLIQLYGHQAGYLYKELSVEQLQNKEGICRDLLLLNKKLDPYYSRLTLYTSVLMYELHSTLLELVDRKIIPPSGIEEAKQLLSESTNILEHEHPNTTGAEMRVLAKKSLHEIQVKIINA